MRNSGVAVSKQRVKDRGVLRGDLIPITEVECILFKIETFLKFIQISNTGEVVIKAPKEVYRRLYKDLGFEVPDMLLSPTEIGAKEAQKSISRLKEEYGE